MSVGLFESRRGASTAIATAFMIIMVMLLFASIWIISSYQIRREGTVQHMTDWDIQRQSENLRIRSVDASAPLGYNFTLAVDNLGGILTRTARIYVHNQTNNTLAVYDPQNGTSIGFVNGTFNVGEVSHQVVVKGKAISGSPILRVTIATDRGNQFTYNYPPPPGSGGTIYYALVIADEGDNFQYAAGTDPNFKSAYVKPKNTDRTLYRVLLNNTTAKKIIFHQNTTMVQMAGAVGQTAHNVRYIVSNQSINYPDNLVPYSSQEINPGATQYAYFATSVPGDDIWQGEVGQGYYLVAFLLYWNYEGETEIRNVPTPSVAQLLQ